MINGNSYAAEVHFVHTSKSGKQAVLGFMLEVSLSAVSYPHSAFKLSLFHDHFKYSDTNNPSLVPLIEVISAINNDTSEHLITKFLS